MVTSTTTHIILCGLPGSGKSTVGKLLAQKRGIPFYDLDALIEAKEKKTISEVFSQKGEDYFRETEHTVLVRFLEEKKQADFVLALGGGTPCFYDNMELARQQGKVFFLDTPIDMLVKRLPDTSTRPLLQNDPEKTLETLLEQRWPFYRQAHFMIDAGRAAQTVVNLIDYYL